MPFVRGVMEPTITGKTKAYSYEMKIKKNYKSLELCFLLSLTP